MNEKLFYSRSDWRAAAPTQLMAQQASPVEVFIHHTDSGDAGIVDTLAEQKDRVRGIQNYHQHGKGWSDIAYHAIIFQPQGSLRLARVFFGRSPDQVPAAQLNHNTGTLAIAVYGNFQEDTVHRNTRYAIEQTIKRLAPKARTLGGHRDVVSTSCPGGHLYQSLDLIAAAANLERYRR